MVDRGIALFAAVLLLGGCSASGDATDGGDEADAPVPGSLGVLPLGNSITQADADHLGYRYALWTRAVDAGLEIDFVGSTREHFGGTPTYPTYRGRTFDPDHEGHWGWRVDEILDGRGSGGLDTWLNEYHADVVLMHLGTNDVFQDQSLDSTVSELRQVVATLRSDNPSVVILWALLLPTADAQSSATIAALNAQASTLASELNTAASPIRTVDLNEGFDAVAWTYDGVHPNADGEAWMADRWFTALQNELSLNAP